MTTALEGGEGSASRPGRSLPPGKTRYPLYRRLCGPQGRSGQVRKISPPPGFDPRTVQPVASRYTGYASRPRPYPCIKEYLNLRNSTNKCSCLKHVLYMRMCWILSKFGYHNPQLSVARERGVLSNTVTVCSCLHGNKPQQNIF